jgi:hypothetical protein
MSHHHHHHTEQETKLMDKKVKVDQNPVEYRTFRLNQELVSHVKIKSLMFRTDQPGDDAPVYLEVVLEIPTDSVLPYQPNPIPHDADQRCFSIYAGGPRDITPLEGATVLASAVAGSTATQLDITMDSGGKVPGGVGAFWKFID